MLYAASGKEPADLYIYKKNKQQSFFHQKGGKPLKVFQMFQADPVWAPTDSARFRPWGTWGISSSGAPQQRK